MRSILTAFVALVATLAFTATAFAQIDDQPPPQQPEDEPDTQVEDETAEMDWTIPEPEEDPTAIQLGITAGATPSTFGGEEFDDTETRVGLIAGGRAIIPFTENFGMQPEVLYVQRGSAFEATEAEVSLNYIEAPILFRASLPIGPVTPKVLIGPTVGVLLNGSVEVDGVDVDLDTDEFNRVDVGATVGAGFDIDVGPGSLSVDARVGQSLMDITDNEPNTFNQGLDLLAGYNFRF